jgi:hypothetical protein
MSAHESRRSDQVDKRAAIAIAAVCLFGLGLILWLNGSRGPATRCEARGGYYLVGPGGETACVDRNTFLPIPE